MRPMQFRLGRRGLDVHLVELSPGAMQDLNSLAEQLSWNVERVLRETGARQVDLVGVSLGGILALLYAQNAAHLGQVRRLVGIGTPWHGSPMATAALPVLGWVSAGVWQIRTAAPLLHQMVAAGIPDHVEVISISMRGDMAAPPSRCVLPGAKNVALGGRATPWTHQWLIMSTAALEETATALKA